jgi:ABC-2 type transport system permease protein
MPGHDIAPRVPANPLGPAIAAVRCELLRLASLRTTWVLIALSAGAAAVDAGAQAWPLANGAVAGVPPHVDAARALAARVPYLPVCPSVLVAAAIGAFAFGHEFRHRTIVVTLAVVPSRSLVVGAKAAAVVAFATVAAGAQLAAAFLGTVVTLSQRVGERWQPTGHVSAAVAGTVLAAVLAGLVGLALAGLLRSAPVVASTLAVLIVAAGPPLSFLARHVGHMTAIGRASHYLPFQAASDLVPVGPWRGAAIGDAAPPIWQAAGTLTGYAGLLLIGCWFSFLRRDP